MESYLARHPDQRILELPGEQPYWNSSVIRRWQTILATCAILLVIASFGMSFLQLPMLVSAGLGYFFRAAFLMKPRVYAAVKDKHIDRNKLLGAIGICLSVLLCFSFPIVMLPFLSAPVLVAAALTVCAFTTFCFVQNLDEKYHQTPIEFCAMGLFVTFAAAPAVTLLASLLAINIGNCFITDSFMLGLHRGIKGREYRKWRSIWKGKEPGPGSESDPDPDPDSPRAFSVHSGDGSTALSISCKH